jgi:DinB family protein
MARENPGMNDTTLRRELVRLLETRDAHMTYDEAVADVPAEAMNQRPPNVAYTPYHLLEHLRLVQRDVLEYVTDPAYEEKPWPERVWPARDATATRDDFDRSIRGFRADRAELRRLIEDPSTDLFAVVAGSPGHTLLREIRLAGDHCAYHVGEFAILRQVMGTWPASHED